MENETLGNMPKLIAAEAQDAMNYAHLALENRESNHDLAEMFMKLSGEELHHMQMISDKLAAMVSNLHAQYNNP